MCDECKGQLIQRADDRVDTVKARLVVYHNDTVGLIPYYRKQGLLREIGGTDNIEQVYANLAGLLQGRS